jgi:hypothetical protein
MASSDTKEDERGRGKIFSPSQREYLRGNKSVTSNHETTLQTRIRQRVIGAIEDIQLLNELDKEDRAYIYQSNKDKNREGLDVDFDDRYGNIPKLEEELLLNEGPVGLSLAFSSVFEFYYKTMRENGYPPEAKCDRLREDLEKAERQLLSDEHGERYEVEATVKIENSAKVDIEDAKKRFKQDGIHAVSKPELKALEEAGYVGFDENPE